MYTNVLMVLVLMATLDKCKPESLAQKYGMKMIHLTADRPRTIIMSDAEKKIFLACEINTSADLEWFYNNEKITSNPPYTFNWKRKSSKARGSVLMIPDLKGKQVDGKYDCVAKTSKGTVKATVNITVKQGHKLPSGFPQIKTHPENVHTERKSVDFHCCVSGKPPFRFNWYYNRRPIQSDDLHEVSPNLQMGKKTCSNLKIKDAHKPTAFFQCVVMNDIGQVVSKEAKIAFNNGKYKKEYWLRKRRDLSLSLQKSDLVDDIPKRNSFSHTVVFTGISIGLLVIATLFALIYKRKKKFLQAQNSITCQPKKMPNVYISYVASEETTEDGISQMVTSLSRYGIRCSVDLLPNCVPERLLNTDNVLVVLTREYITTLNEDKVSHSNTAQQKFYKILTEFDHIKQHACQGTSRFIILGADDIKVDELPHVLKDCTICPYPKKFDENDELFTKLLGILLDVERPIQLSASVQIM